MMLALDPLQPPVDGRQSETALMIQRGVGRFLMANGMVMVTELPLASGRRADIVAINGTGEIWIVEIKSSVEDFRSDLKWPEYKMHCDKLFFASHAGVPADLFPQSSGLILADAYGAEMIRDGLEHRLAGSRRKAVLIRFGHAAASRLHQLHDPDAHRAS